MDDFRSRIPAHANRSAEHREELSATFLISSQVQPHEMCAFFHNVFYGSAAFRVGPWLWELAAKTPRRQGIHKTKPVFLGLTTWRLGVLAANLMGMNPHEMTQSLIF